MCEGNLMHEINCIHFPLVYLVWFTHRSLQYDKIWTCNYWTWQNASSTVIISQISVPLTYIKGSQIIGPKLLNIHFERHWVLFQLLVNIKMEK